VYPCGHQPGPEPQGEERLRPAERLDVGGVALGFEQAHRTELVVEQVRHVVGAHVRVQRAADTRRHRGDVTVAVDVGHDLVDQPGQMEHLAVAAAHEVMRLTEG
jgi:hypothetical protein